MIDHAKVSCYVLAMALFGENLKRLRKDRDVTQEVLAERLGFKRPGPIALQETKFKARVPKPDTVRRYAAALGVSPADLMKGVVTEHDRLRQETAVLEVKKRPRRAASG